MSTTSLHMNIQPKQSTSRWVTVDSNGKIISEGKTPESAVKKAEKQNKEYALVFVPKKGDRYVF